MDKITPLVPIKFFQEVIFSSHLADIAQRNKITKYSVI